MEQTNEKREASKGQSFELSTTKEKQRKENVKQTASEQNQQRKGNGEKNTSSTQSTKSFLRHFYFWNPNKGFGRRGLLGLARALWLYDAPEVFKVITLFNPFSTKFKR